MTTDPFAARARRHAARARRGAAMTRWGWSLLWLLCCLTLALGCQGGAGNGGDGLLAGKAPSRNEGVRFAERITDGRVPRMGTAWNSNRTATFDSKSSFVEYDLGAERKIAAAAILADNNDRYELLGSKDGTDFRPLWAAEPVPASGVRWRHTQELDAEVRFVRLQSRRGDASISVGELVLYSEANVALPPKLQEVSAVPADLGFRNALLVFATAAAAAVVFAWSGASLFWLGLLVLGVVAAAVPLVRAFLETWPIEQLEVALTRGVLAALAGVVVGREAFGPRGYPPHRWITLPLLSLTAFLSVMAFYNLGRAQFHDHRLDKPSYVHNYDMRVYFPVAKYFDELRYDGLYLASVATYAEEHGGLDRPNIQKVELRDLRDHRMRRVDQVRDEVEAIKQRFTPERWAELKEDMRYFWETMGSRGYLGSMRDHGGNATPFWLALAHLMFANAQASNEVLLWAALLDPLLLVGLFVAIWRSFGVRTALVAMVVFGANDFYMFGSNWAGATLRHDWMVYLGLGACALKTQRWTLGGALLAMSALIRAFPAIALFALALPLAWWLVERYRERETLPSWREVLEEHRWLVQAAAGALGCAVFVFLFSSLILGFEAWPLWVKKITSFNADPHVNHVSLLTVTSGSEGNQAMVRAARLPFHVGAIAVYVGLTAWVSRRAAPHQVALLGTMLIPVLFYPANYYIHFIFLLPMLVDERAVGSVPRLGEHTAKVWLLLLGLCAAQYFTVKERDLAIHFYNASVLLMAALLGILVVLAQRAQAESWPRLALSSGKAQGAGTRGSTPSSEALTASGAEAAEGASATEEAAAPVADAGRSEDEAPGKRDVEDERVV